MSRWVIFLQFFVILYKSPLSFLLGRLGECVALASLLYIFSYVFGGILSIFKSLVSPNSGSILSFREERNGS